MKEAKMEISEYSAPEDLARGKSRLKERNGGLKLQLSSGIKI